MSLRPARLTKMSTALLVSSIALPVSLIAFVLLYVNGESFWSVLWLTSLLPAVWVIAIVLSIRDALKRHSGWPVLGVAALLAPTVLLATVIATPRFLLHQLFTFRPVDFHLPTSGVAFNQKFRVCEQEGHCDSHGTVVEIRTFALNKVPEGCCSLRVLNGSGVGKHRVDAFRVVLNGNVIKLASSGGLQIAPVELSSQNEISVQISGPPDAYIYVFVLYTGKKDVPPA